MENLQENKGKKRKFAVEMDEKLYLPWTVFGCGSLYFADICG